ncbi:MAG TPA: GNAT family N-acetyltransferase, partial [Terrimesophilobacter sp.]|nr:GNAT family N-acetyltransferase [Terrimesophilobacter sp.]
ARAFVDHPEQGALTQRDLDARKAETWFDPESFLLLYDGDELVGSNWLKIDPTNPTLGEIYAIAVSPEHQGKGHSRRLMDAGLTRLRERGATTASLYVEADNTPALALYERYGFVRHTIDVQYSRA